MSTIETYKNTLKNSYGISGTNKSIRIQIAKSIKEYNYIISALEKQFKYKPNSLAWHLGIQYSKRKLLQLKAEQRFLQTCKMLISYK